MTDFRERTLYIKKEQLLERLSAFTKEDVCVAFSGGVDSSLLLVMTCEAAKRNGRKVYALTMDTVLHPKADLAVAKKVLEGTTAIHQVLSLDELEIPEIRDNPENRCYLCKKELYLKMLDFAAQKGVSVLLEGSNEDDLHVYRPGLQAVRELGVKSPLAESGITKKEVRELALGYGISVSDRPSSPCLATRLPYGARLDLSLLRRIDSAEMYLKDLGFYNVRVRVHAETARVEVDIPDFLKVIEKREMIVSNLKKMGFSYVTLDLEGFRSGSMDEGLMKKKQKNKEEIK